MSRYVEVDADERTWDVAVLAPEDPEVVRARDLKFWPYLREWVGGHRNISSQHLRLIEQAKARRARYAKTTTDRAE